MKINKPHKYKFNGKGIDGLFLTGCECGLPRYNPIHTRVDNQITTVGKKVLDKNTRDNRIHKEGFDAGHKEGYKEGYKEGTLETIRYSLLNSFEGHSGKGEA